MLELSILLLLILLNGLLSGAEIALVSSRQARLRRLAEDGSHAAAAALALRAVPERFLATVQVGITLIGAMAGAFGGSTLAVSLAQTLRSVPWLGDAAEELAFALVVALITFLSVVFGELVPKSLALRSAERYALLVARPMRALAQAGRPVVWLFATSSNLVLRLFRDHTSFLESRVSRDDLEAMVHEAHSAGVVDAPTSTLMARALEFSSLRVDEVMVHRRAVVAIARDAGDDELRRVLLGTGHRRVPVIGTGIDDVVGYLLRDDVFARVWDRQPIDVPGLLRKPLFVPETMPAAEALEEMRSRQLPLAIVLDEHGGMAGIVTLEDLVEELVGDILHERDPKPADTLRREADGAWLVQGSSEVREVERRIGLELPDSTASRTLGGLVVELAGGRLPETGQVLAVPGGTLEVVEVSPRRVRVVRIRCAEVGGDETG